MSGRDTVGESLRGYARRLIVNPITITATAAGAVVSTLPGVPDAYRFTLFVIAATLAGGALVYRKHLSVAARVIKELTACGLVHRRRDGAVVCPKQYGLTTFEGLNRRFMVTLPSGIGLADVERELPAVEQKFDWELECEMRRGRLHVHAKRHAIPDLVDFDDFYRERRVGALPVGLGCGRRGPIWIDLADLPHLLIGGATGSGKSVAVRQLVTKLVMTNPPERLGLHLVDLKVVELTIFENLPHLRDPIATDVAAAERLLTGVRLEVDRRLAELRRCGASDIDELARMGHARWDRRLVIIEELAEITAAGLGEDKGARSVRQTAIERIESTARLARAVGIHLCLCTQRPDADALPGAIKANLAGTIALRVRNPLNARILVEDDRPARLPHVPGRAIWAHERLEEFQGIHLSTERCRELLADVVMHHRARTCEAGSARVTPTLRPLISNTPPDHQPEKRIGFRPRPDGGDE